MKQIWSVIIALGTLVLFAACGGGASANSAAVQAGRELYETGGDSRIPCATCHTLDGTDLVGPSFQGLRERAGSRIPGMSAEEYIRQSILNPGAYIVAGYQNSMNATYGQFFGDEDVDNSIAFLMSLE
jgi:mono/diheme cytochrome c family protein